MKLLNSFWKKLRKESFVPQQEVNLPEFIKFKTNRKILIKVDNISQIYSQKTKREKVIFQNISFNIHDGDKIALMGANGAGKTTIVEIIAGFKFPTSGKIIKNFKGDLPISKQIGVQFQDLMFPKSLRVEDALKFIVNIDDSNITEEEVTEIVDVFQITPFLKTKISKTSGGQQQRLNVLLSLISKPKVLFLDEFTTGLDIASKNTIKKFIVSFCRKHKINLVIISHDIETIQSIINRVILIGNKKIMVDASIDQINKKFGSFSKLVSKYIK